MQTCKTNICPEVISECKSTWSIVVSAGKFATGLIGVVSVYFPGLGICQDKKRYGFYVDLGTYECLYDASLWKYENEKQYWEARCNLDQMCTLIHLCISMLFVSESMPMNNRGYIFVCNIREEYCYEETRDYYDDCSFYIYCSNGSKVSGGKVK